MIAVSGRLTVFIVSFLLVGVFILLKDHFRKWPNGRKAIETLKGDTSNVVDLDSATLAKWLRDLKKQKRN